MPTLTKRQTPCNQMKSRLKSRLAKFLVSAHLSNLWRHVDSWLTATFYARDVTSLTGARWLTLWALRVRSGSFSLENLGPNVCYYCKFDVKCELKGKTKFDTGRPLKFDKQHQNLWHADTFCWFLIGSYICIFTWKLLDLVANIIILQISDHHEITILSNLMMN